MGKFWHALATGAVKVGVWAASNPQLIQTILAEILAAQAAKGK